MSVDHDQEFSPPPEKQLPFEPSELRSTSKLSVLSLVSGIMGITILPLLGSLVAIVTGHAALGEIREASGRLGGRATAKAGLWLGYVPVVLVLIGAILLGVLFLRFGPQGLNDLNYGRMPATPTSSSLARGVKMVNEMSRDDFKLIEESQLDVQPNEIIACYNADGSSTEPEFALITTKILIYLKEGRTTVFPLNEIKMLKDNDAFQRAYDPNFFDGISYRMEVQSKEGQRMRIVITPREEGGIFFDALKSAIPVGGVLNLN